MSQDKQQQKIVRLAESGLMLAIAAVLSLVKILDLPYGGSITACSSLPILLVAYRHGVRWGLFTATAYSLLELLLGLNALSYVTTPLSVVAVILLDFVLAFTVMGLGGVFRRDGISQGRALVLGALLTGCLRYVCHVISGCTVWAGLSIPTHAAFFYSLAYNATYMVPETVVTMLGAWYLSRVVDLGGTMPARAETIRHRQGAAAVLTALSRAAVLVAAVWDVREIFAPLQDADTGDFVIANLAQVSWLTVAAVSAGGVLLTVALEAVARRLNRRKTEK